MLCICVVFQQIDSMYLGKGTRLVVHPSIHSFVHPSMNNTYVHTVQVSAHSVAIELQLQPDTFSTNHRFPGVLQLGSWTPRHVRLLCCFGDRVIIFRSLLIFLLSFLLLTYSVEGLTHEFVSVSVIMLASKNTSWTYLPQANVTFFGHSGWRVDSWLVNLPLRNPLRHIGFNNALKRGIGL